MTEQEELAIDAGATVYNGGPHFSWRGLEEYTATIREKERQRIASQIDRMPFGDTAASFAVWIRAGAP